MPRYGPFIHQVHIADGFADDCDEVVHQCLQVENLNYQTFCNIWKKQNISCLYKGRVLGAEIAELSEEVIHIAKHYMLKNTSNFEESVAGLFILYALLNLQPYAGFAHLRIVPEDLPAIDRIELVARREKRHDVLYILASVLIKGPVQYHAAAREYGLDIGTRKYLESFTSIDHLGMRPKGVFYRQNEELDVIKELDVITKRYTQAKMAISDPAEFYRNLNYIDSNLTTELHTSLKQLISGIHEEQYGFVDIGKDGNNIWRKRKQIKDKAMQRGVDPVKYLMTAGDKNISTDSIESPTKEKSSPKKGRKKIKDKKEIKQSDVENTTLKMSNVVKRRLPLNSRALKKICSRNALDKKDSCTESKDSEALNEKIDTDSNVELDATGSSNKTKTASDTPTSNSEKSQESQEESVERELDIHIDFLPVLIRTEDQGKLFEIEIIDGMEKTEPAIKRSPPRKTYSRKPNPQTALNKINEMPEVSIKKIEHVKPQTDDNAGKAVPSTSAAGNDLAILLDLKDHTVKPLGVDEEKKPCLKKPDKRSLKRVHIQSKFKRLGMLPVANFEPSEDDIQLQEEVEEEDIDLPTNTGLSPIEN